MLERLVQREASDAERFGFHVWEFERHVKNLSLIYSAGILSHGFAIIVSKPSGKACRDDMRFYIRDLLTRMKVGDVEMKKQALIKLNESMEEDDRYMKIVIEISDMVNVLIEFLDSEMGIQEEASKAMLLISGFDSYKPVLIRSCVVGPLVRVLENGNDVGREASARCLMKLTENSENAWSVSAHGGVAALLKICSCGEFGGELIASSCGVLRNLVGVEEIKRYMIEDEAERRIHRQRHRGGESPRERRRRTPSREREMI